MTRVLIVDDSSAVRAYVRAALEAADELEAEVEEAVNGFEALRVLPRESFDLLILDINMPNIHGLELISMLRRSERYSATPVLVISTETLQTAVMITLFRKDCANGTSSKTVR